MIYGEAEKIKPKSITSRTNRRVLPWVPGAGIIMEGGGWKYIVGRQVRRNKMKKNCSNKRIRISLKASTEQIDR